MSRKSTHQRLRHCAFSHEEDANLTRLVGEMGDNQWINLARNMKRRSAKQCRERWAVLQNRRANQRPWTDEEDQLLLDKYYEVGPKWNIIEMFFVNRNSVILKNRFEFLLQSHQMTPYQSEIPEKEVEMIKPEPEKTIDEILGFDDYWDSFSYPPKTDVYDLFNTDKDQMLTVINLPNTRFMEIW